MAWVPNRAALALFVAVFMLALRGMVPADGSWGIDPRWIYAVTVLAVRRCWRYWREYGELSEANAAELGGAFRACRRRRSRGLRAVDQLDAKWMQLSEPTAFVPIDTNGQLLWPLIAVRWIGAVQSCR